MGKHRILALDSQGAHQRNDFSEPRPLHLPIHRKALNSLTWDIWFSLINSNLLMFWLPGLHCKTPIYPRSSLTSSEQSLRATWEAASGAWSPQKVCQMKQFSTFRMCIFFSRHLGAYYPTLNITPLLKISSVYLTLIILCSHLFLPPDIITVLNLAFCIRCFTF